MEKERNRKRLFFEVLQKLTDAHPLQQQIESASQEVRAAYAKVLRHWVRYGAPPPMDIAAEPLLMALASMDALVIDKHGIGCYPFSARDTGISAHYSGKTVQTMCAVGGLGIARLAQCTTNVMGCCVVCVEPLACAIGANGELAHGEAKRAGVIWQTTGLGTGPCCDSLCPGIRFICEHCAAPDDAVYLTLPEATALANALLKYRRRLLTRGSM